MLEDDLRLRIQPRSVGIVAMKGSLGANLARELQKPSAGGSGGRLVEFYISCRITITKIMTTNTPITVHSHGGTAVTY